MEEQQQSLEVVAVSAARRSLEVVACAVAVSVERRAAGFPLNDEAEPSAASFPADLEGSWRSEFLGRCAEALGLTGEDAREAWSASQRHGRDEDDFVHVGTAEVALAASGARASKEAGHMATIAANEIAHGTYDARSRAALKLAVRRGLQAPWTSVAEKEAVGPTMTTEETLLPPLTAMSQLRVTVRVSLAAVGGGALLALSGGVAAPSIAASLVGGAAAVSGAAAAESVATVLACAITGVFGALGAGVSGFKAKRRFAVEEDRWVLVQRTFREDPTAVLRFLLIPGWLDGGDPRAVWGGRAAAPDAISHDREEEGFESLDDEDYDWWRERQTSSSKEHVLVWERESLKRLHLAMKSAKIWVEARERVASGIVDELLRRSALGAATLPVGMLKLAASIDDPWGMALRRAPAAGVRLAHSIANRSDRSPLTLVGYSMGALVLMCCLEELAGMDGDGCLLVENAVLLGAPLEARPARWLKARRVVTGRLINGFSKHDWMLQLVYRSKAWSLSGGVAGAQPVEIVSLDSPCTNNIVENVDLSSLVNAHLAYPLVMPQIFEALDLE